MFLKLTQHGRKINVNFDLVEMFYESGDRSQAFFTVIVFGKKHSIEVSESASEIRILLAEAGGRK